MSSEILHSTCRVKGCRFAKTHITSFHKCGTCGKSGHGQMECGKPAAIQKLEAESDGDEIHPHTRCTVKDCDYYSYHTTAGHVCFKPAVTIEGELFPEEGCKQIGGNKCKHCQTTSM